MIKNLLILLSLSLPTLSAQVEIKKAEEKKAIDFKQVLLKQIVPRLDVENCGIVSLTHRTQCMTADGSPKEIYFSIDKYLEKLPEFQKAKFTFSKEQVPIGEVMEALQKQTGILYEVRQCIVLYSIGNVNAGKPVAPKCKINQKFNKILIPKINLDKAKIKMVVGTIESLTRDNDSEPKVHKKGIKFAYGHPLIHDRKFGDIRFTFNKEKATTIEVMDSFRKQTGVQYIIYPCIVIYGMDPSKVK